MRNLNCKFAFIASLIVALFGTYKLVFPTELEKMAQNAISYSRETTRTMASANKLLTAMGGTPVDHTPSETSEMMETVESEQQKRRTIGFAAVALGGISALGILGFISIIKSG